MLFVMGFSSILSFKFPQGLNIFINYNQNNILISQIYVTGISTDLVNCLIPFCSSAKKCFRPGSNRGPSAC